MTEEKNNNTDELKDDKEVKSEVTEKETTDSKEEVGSVRTEINEDKEAKSGLEELPDDIKKKLEKRSAERAKKGASVKKKKKKTNKRVSAGKAFIKATYNNTIVTLTDLNGNVLSWASAGVAGFRGAKKSTPYAASIIARIAVEKAMEYGLKEVSVFVKGIGTGRESAVRALNANGLNITLIKDTTPVPHNGCRARKPRRV